MTLAALIDGAADLLVGAQCPGCGHPGLGVCAACRAQLRGRRLVVRGLGGEPPFTAVAAGDYSGVVKAVLIAAKERQALGLVPVLAERLTVAITVLAAASSTRSILLVPVPSARTQIAHRGQDFTTALARQAAARLRRGGVPTSVSRCLRHRRNVEDQAGLDRSARQRNLAGAFVLTRTPPSGTVIVVDDIVTTGATLSEALRVLAQAGRTPRGAATVAATPLRRRLR